MSEEMRLPFSGSPLPPGNAGYDKARRFRNGLINNRRGLIAQCTTTAVVNAVHVGR